MSSVYAVGNDVIVDNVLCNVVGIHPTIAGLLRVYDGKREFWTKDTTVIAVE